MFWWTRAQWARAQELTKPFCPKVLSPSRGRCCRVVTAFGDPHPSRILGVMPLGMRAAPHGLSSCSSRSIQGASGHRWGALSPCTPLPLLVLTRLSSGSPPWDFGIQTLAGACWEHPRKGLCPMGTGQQVEKGAMGECKQHSKQRKNTTNPRVLLLPWAPTSIFSCQALGWML